MSYNQPIILWVDYMYVCMLFSPNLDKHSQMFPTTLLCVHNSSATSPSFQPDVITNKFIIDSLIFEQQFIVRWSKVKFRDHSSPAWIISVYILSELFVKRL